VVKQVDFKALKTENLNKLTELDADFAEVLESDPAAKILEVDAYVRTVDLTRVNDAARKVMLAYSTGTSLDNLGLLFGVTRATLGTDGQGRTLYEDDERLRRRIQLAPGAYSVAGPPEAYVFWALTWAPNATDASVFVPTPGTVQVTLLGPGADAQPLPSEVAAVRVGFATENVRPMTDNVIVAPATITPYAIEAEYWLLPGPDAAVVEAQINAELDAVLTEHRKLGRDMARSVLIDAIQSPAVSRVNLISPAADVLIDDRFVALPTSRKLTLKGRER
jgi:phage-related baseplate assembly protein